MTDEADRPRVVFSEPTPGQMIRELHCWIATYPDGTEGIMAHGTEGYGVMPLVSSDRSLAERLERAARDTALQVNRQTGHTVTIRLATFTSTEGTRQ